MAEDWRALNRAAWDERVAVHVGPGGYDLTALRSGLDRLDVIVGAELEPVAGKRVLHLQCHFGADSLRLARAGADVTALDFSSAAIDAAKALTAELGQSARFVCADLYDAPTAIPEPAAFDLVFVTWGATCWLPDIAGWAKVVAFFLKPGGALYLAEAHPVAYVFDELAPVDANGRPGWHRPYFDKSPFVYDADTSYADDTATLTNTRQVNWLHPIADVLGALRSAGLQLDWLHEHPRVPWRMFENLVRDADGMWTWPDRMWLPLSFSLRAVRS